MTIRVLLLLLLTGVAGRSFAEEDLTHKVVRLPLNQDSPATVRLGLNGVTTIEFPSKIEALDGFGFSPNPNPEGSDLFQIAFNKGTNFVSLKAAKPGAEGNLTVVLNGRVYCLYCKEAGDPSFLVIFEEESSKRRTEATPVAAKIVSPARLLGFLDKVKAFPSLKVSAPEMYQNMDVSEPNSKSAANGLDVTIKRVIRDDALDSVGFELALANHSDKEVLYDPESFGVRVGEVTYQQSVSDAAGMVPPGKAQTAFFIVTGGNNGGRNDLAVTNKFEVVFRPVQGELDPQRKVSAQWQEPPDSLPGEMTRPSKISRRSVRGTKLSQKSVANSQLVPGKSPSPEKIAQHNE
ncbi:MAG: hypothetical protein JO331_14330 [Verrucomicrobia bacterium]|nr:hypothetical protein [Verrucomicrobiota bacterium]